MNDDLAAAVRHYVAGVMASAALTAALAALVLDAPALVTPACVVSLTLSGATWLILLVCR